MAGEELTKNVKLTKKFIAILLHYQPFSSKYLYSVSSGLSTKHLFRTLFIHTYYFIYYSLLIEYLRDCAMRLILCVHLTQCDCAMRQLCQPTTDLLTTEFSVAQQLEYPTSVRKVAGSIPIQSPSQPFLVSSRNTPRGEERCVTILKTAARETNSHLELRIFPVFSSPHIGFHLLLS